MIWNNVTTVLENQNFYKSLHFSVIQSIKGRRLHEAYFIFNEIRTNKCDFWPQFACKGTLPTKFSWHVGTRSNPLEKLTNECKGSVLRYSLWRKLWPKECLDTRKSYLHKIWTWRILPSDSCCFLEHVCEISGRLVLAIQRTVVSKIPMWKFSRYHKLCKWARTILTVG